MRTISRHTLRSAVLLLLGLMTAAGAGRADNLYKVTITSRTEATILKDLPGEAALRVPGGYLVFLDERGAEALRASRLSYGLIGSGISRDDVALDLRRDEANARQYPVLYKEGSVRLVDVRAGVTVPADGWAGLARLPEGGVPIVWGPRYGFDADKVRELGDLDSLVGLMSMDSCQSYVERLQEFSSRVAGTYGNRQSREWLIDKFESFGYDSVFTDSFWAIESWGAGDSIRANNVIAVKEGSVYPNHYIVIGGHRDSYPEESPGADDNATGTAGVLEMARVLADIDTRLTFVFVGFDGEEMGLWGAKYYASEAFNRGDSIALMINMDMIAYMDNDTGGYVTHSVDSDLGDLWAALADSLTGINITPTLSAGAVWDASPFEQMGWEAMTIHEYNMLPHVHTVHDSAVYCDWDYMLRLMKPTLATAVVVDDGHVAAPLQFVLLEEPATMIPAGVPCTLSLRIMECGAGMVEPGSAWLHYRVDEGAADSLALTCTGGDLYTAVIPAQYAMGTVRSYYTVADTSGVRFCYPDSLNPLTSLVATRESEQFADDFETDLNWQVSGEAWRGRWERAIPDRTGAWGAPPGDYSGYGKCYLTGAGMLINLDGGSTVLTSPAIGVGYDVPAARIRYARWYSNAYPMGEPNADTFRVFLRTQGSGWQLVEEISTGEEADGGWYVHDFMTTELLTLHAYVQLQFVATDQGAESWIEAAVDNVTVMTYSCEPLILTESLPEWTVGVPYAEELAAAACCSTLAWLEAGDTLGNAGLTLSGDGVVTGVPSSAGTVSFMATVADDSGETDQRGFAFQLNPAVDIVTETLPNGMAGGAYSQQLAAAGGTGSLTWEDKNGDLAGTGLTLEASGIVSGTPTDSGLVEFVAAASDAVGSLGEKALSIWVDPHYLCGDVDGNQAGPNVLDLTYLVNYLFKGGPAPPIMAAANADGEGGNELNVTDLTYLVSYLFKGGPAPVC